MKKSLTGTVDTTDTSILTVEPGRVACDVGLTLNNKSSTAAPVSLWHRRAGEDALVEKTLLGATGADNAATRLSLDGLVFGSADELVLTSAASSVSIKYVLSHLELKKHSDTLSVLETFSHTLLEGLTGKQVCFLESPIPSGPPTVSWTPPVAQNANAKSMTTEVALTSSFQDVLSVSITPGAADADIRIWVTLLWRGIVTYRLEHEHTPAGTRTATTSAITSDLAVTGAGDETSTEPVVFPIVHAPGLATPQTYKLHAKALIGDATVEVGTTLYVEELPG